MDKELKRIQFNYDKNRKKKMTVQIHNLVNYISGSRAIETFCSEIIRMTNNPYIKDDPEAILLNLKDYCNERLKFAVDEKYPPTYTVLFLPIAIERAPSSSSPPKLLTQSKLP